jgi:hypothetical protein
MPSQKFGPVHFAWLEVCKSLQLVPDLSRMNPTHSLCFRFILMHYYLNLQIVRPPPWSSGQCSWLQIQMSGFDSRRYQIFCEVVSLERGPLSLVSTIEELLVRKSIGFDLEIQEYSRRDPSR